MYRMSYFVYVWFARNLGRCFEGFFGDAVDHGSRLAEGAEQAADAAPAHARVLSASYAAATPGVVRHRQRAGR